MIIYCLLLLICKIYFVIIPAMFRYTNVQRRLMFRNNSDRCVHSPERYGFHGARVHYLSSDGSIQIGLWHIPPQSDNDLCQIGIGEDNRVVVMYAHGSGGSRASKHRIALYKLLTKQLGLHVVTFDYRGFADSTYVWPTSDGTVHDAAIVYQWILEQGVDPKRIMVWGHSLGSGIIIRLLSSLSDHQYPFAAILEAPFTTIRDVLQYCSISRLYNYLPYFESCFMDRIVNNPETNYDSISLLDRLRCPLTILHADNDWMVSQRLGRRLYEIATDVQPEHVPRARFHSFPSVHSHSKIVYNPQLANIVADVIHSYCPCDKSKIELSKS